MDTLRVVPVLGRYKQDARQSVCLRAGCAGGSRRTLLPTDLPAGIVDVCEVFWHGRRIDCTVIVTATAQASFGQRGKHI
jgi:hypothetical protein